MVGRGEGKGWWEGHLAEERGDLLDRDVVGRVRVELGPDLGKVLEVGGGDEVGVGVVQVGEVLEDDRDHEVEEDERAEDLERDEVRHRGEARAARVRLVGAQPRLLGEHRLHHQLRPAVAGEALEEQQRRRADRDEVALVVDALEVGRVVREEREELHAEDGVDVDDEREQRAHVEQRGEREHLPHTHAPDAVWRERCTQRRSWAPRAWWRRGADHREDEGLGLG